MKLNTPPYQLVRMAEHEWAVEESEEMVKQSIKFGDIMERYSAKRGLTSALRRFLNKYPGHVDALHHYGVCKLEEGLTLEAYAFAHTAVVTARRFYPPEFDPSQDALPGEWIPNRPFLRALHGLMQARRAIHDHPGAIEMGNTILTRDPVDRMGVRMELPEILLGEGRNQDALDLFSRPDFKDTFGPTVYLETLAWLRVGKKSRARQALANALEDYPQVARYLLEELPTVRPTEGESPFGVTVGSPYEGWLYAGRYHWLWREPENALDFLRKESAPFARNGWKTTFVFTPSKGRKR